MAGAGPAGLALALQAHAHGALVRVIDRRPEAVRPSRALILHARTLEVLRPLGVTRALLARADIAPAADLRLGSRVVRVTFGDLALPDTAFPHLSLVRQMDVERVLAQALADRGVEVERGTELAAVREEPGGVRAVLRSPAGSEQAWFGFAAGCDGPASTVRAQAGLGWAGRPYPVEIVLADAELDGDLAERRRPGRGGPGRAAVRLPPRRAGDLAAARDPPRDVGAAAARNVRPPGFRHRPAGPDRRRGAGRAAHRPGVVLAGRGATAGGRPVPAGPAVPGRGRRARLLPRHRPGDERRHPGRRQPRLEARVRGGPAAAGRCSIPTTASAARWRVSCWR